MTRRQAGEIAQSARRKVGLGLALATLAGLAPACAGEGLDRLAALVKRKPAESAASSDAKAGAIASSLNWWSIPRSARSAARTLAKSQDAAVTRCVAVEREDRVVYEVHASHRLGLFKKDDFVLTSVSEPKAAAEQRREEQTLRRRVQRLREAGAAAVKRPARKGPDGLAPPSGASGPFGPRGE